MVKYLDHNHSSNLTNKYNPQEPLLALAGIINVQILPINTILKNAMERHSRTALVQILPINTILKNQPYICHNLDKVQILPINTILKNP